MSADPSITDIGEPALVNASSIEITRGALLAGRYQIEAVIGKGGSGIVLRAFDRVAQVPVAVKILKPELATDPRWVERFSRELRLARQIQHPNVCRVFDIGQADGHWFITMELATGGTLREHLGENAAKRSTEAKVSDVLAVVAGLAAIHEAGIVHRDVKPDNFLRMGDGRLVLSDFGLATNPADAPAISIMVGTPHYMAPEVVAGEAATQRSDVWSAAVVIHEILCGLRPRRGGTGSPQPRANHVTATKVERALMHACVAPLEPEPDDRPQSGSQLLTIVNVSLRARFQLPSVRWISRPQSFWGAISLCALVLFAVFGKRLWQSAHASRSFEGTLHGAIAIHGEALDWSRGSKVLATIDSPIHCLTLLSGGTTARMIWGTPRRAEDIDLETAKRTISEIPPMSYQTGCPQLSPKGDSLLFTRMSENASAQIVRSGANGENPSFLTTGADPLWLPSGEEFVFDMDTGHVGVFSLPTMNSTLLSDDRGQTSRYLYKKALSPTGDLLAVAYHGDAVDRLLEVYSLPDLHTVASWRMPLSIRGIQFAGPSLRLTDASGYGTIDGLSWKTGEAIRLGFVPGRALDAVSPAAGGRNVLLSSIKSSDVWIFEPGRKPRQLTHDGRSYGASWAPSGDVLVAKQLADERFVIFRYDRSGTGRQITNGPFDVLPSFSSDGTTWSYSDYHRNAIRLCDDDGCNDLAREPLAGWPVVAPDREHVAFVAQGRTSRLGVVDTHGGTKHDLGPVALGCPPVWSSDKTVWAYSGTPTDPSWTEIDITTAMKTGRSRRAIASNPDTLACAADSEPSDSPFFQRARIVAREGWEVRLTPAFAVMR